MGIEHISISTLYKYHLHKYILLATEVETFIAKFPMAEVLTCPEDKLTKCPPEIFEEIFQYLDSEDLKSVVLVNKTLCDVGKKPKFWYKSMVRLQSLDA